MQPSPLFPGLEPMITRLLAPTKSHPLFSSTNNRIKTNETDNTIMRVQTKEGEVSAIIDK